MSKKVEKIYKKLHENLTHEEEKLLNTKLSNREIRELFALMTEEEKYNILNMLLSSGKERLVDIALMVLFTGGK